jgi:hypothetical protein
MSSFLRHGLFHRTARSLVILLGAEAFRFRHGIRWAVHFIEPHDAVVGHGKESDPLAESERVQLIPHNERSV